MSKSQASNAKLTPLILQKIRKIKIAKPQLPSLRTTTVHVSALTVFVAIVSLSCYVPGGAAVSSLFTTDVSAAQDNPSVDDETELQIAGNIALHANLPIAANITNRSTSLEIENNIRRSEIATIIKPLMLMPATNNRVVVDYQVNDGDTIQSIADQFNITPQTIKWANDLTADTVNVGTILKIPPIDGVLHTPTKDETIESIAEKYTSEVALIVAFNDLELSGVKSNEQIIIPKGELPAEEQPGYVAPVAMAAASITTTPVSDGSSLINGYSPIAMVASGNAYAFGNCTSWAYERRVQLGYPVGSYWGNGATWDSSARAAGYIVDKNPTVGAVYQMPAFIDAYTGVYGHVGIVEAVNSDGSIYISEMNYAGNFNAVTYRTIPAEQVGLYNYIH